ncbi:MAG: ATP-binding protein [Acidobacteria bacterium]|nr:ATP-binding protein [Acidobacteriota bacterium]
MHQSDARAGPLQTGLRITIDSALNRPVDDWGKLLGDTAAVTALLDRLLHHAHVLKCGPRSWRTKVHTDLRTEEATK